jgi:hypothetical protein
LKEEERTRKIAKIVYVPCQINNMVAAATTKAATISTTTLCREYQYQSPQVYARFA